MNFSYDKKTDSLSLILKNDKVDDTEEIRPGIIFDFNEQGSVISIEILNASAKIDKLNKLEIDNRIFDLELA